MAYIFNSPKFNNIVLCGILITFSMAILTPPSCQAANVNFNDVAFGVRIEKLVEKVIRYKDKGDSHKLLDIMIDIKNEVQGYTGVAINLDNELDKVESEIKRSGGKVNKDDMKKLRKVIKKKEKKAAHKAFCMEIRMLNPDFQLTGDDEHMLYMARHEHDKDEQEDATAGELPLRLTIGVTVALCGLFLFVLPPPPCKVWGADLMKAGTALAIEGYVNGQEDDKHDSKKKKAK